jgi:hypothetical protein
MAFSTFAFYARFAVGPRLRSISVVIEKDKYGFGVEYPWDNVASVLESAPSVKEFKVDGNGDDFPDDECFDHSQTIRSFNDLEYFNSRPLYLSHNTLAHLATVNRLKELTITIHSHDLAKFNLTDAFETEFPSLTKLAIVTTLLHHCTVLLERPSFRKLEALEITRLFEHLPGKCAVWDVDSFFNSLRDHLPHSCLWSLHILGSGFYTSPAQHIGSKITLNTLSPLFPFTNLSDIQITLDESVELNDAELRTVAKAWPNLRILRLFERTTTWSPRVTLFGLLSLLALCPKLEELTLRMDASELPIFAQLKDMKPSPHLHSLDVCTSPLKDVPGMVAFLALAIPRLRSLSFGWRYSSQLDQLVDMHLTMGNFFYLARWKNVCKILTQVMTSRRCQETDSEDWES